MQTGYFNAAWQDIKNSPGWFGKLVVLSLVSLIPIFGWIVVYGYLFGWARDMAWGLHSPLPAHIFGNEDGKLYRRGFFALVIAFICMIIPALIDCFGNFLTGASFAGFNYGVSGIASFPFQMGLGIAGAIMFVVSLVAWVLATMFSWVGTMRMSIYDRLSAGFQFGKMWKMIRHDSGGMLRVFGMTIALSLVASIAAVLVGLLLVTMGFVFGALAAGGSLSFAGGQSSAAAVGWLIGLGGLLVLLLIMIGFATVVMSIFVEMMTARALGYWMKQFDVSSWRGQDDLMPFEQWETH